MKTRSLLIQCPHCYFHVLPSRDGFCPSCHKDVHDLSGIDPSMTLMDVPDTMTLPDYCLTCARPTKRRVKILSKVDRDMEPTILNFLKHLSLVFWTPAYAYAEYGDMDGTSPTVILDVPHCGECAGRGKPKPVHTDFENMCMTFIVHKKFKKKVRPTVKSTDAE